MIMDILTITFGFLTVSSVIGIIAYTLIKTKKNKHELEIKKMENTGGISTNIENLQNRIEVLENLTQDQNLDIKQLREENSFFHKLLEDKS